MFATTVITSRIRNIAAALTGRCSHLSGSHKRRRERERPSANLSYPAAYQRHPSPFNRRPGENESGHRADLSIPAYLVSRSWQVFMASSACVLRTSYIGRENGKQQLTQGGKNHCEKSHQHQSLTKISSTE